MQPRALWAATLAATVVLAFCPLAVAGVDTPAWTLSGPSNSNSPGTGVFGTEFTVKRTITVTAIGWYDEPMSPAGLEVSHEVGIFDAGTEQLLVSVTVPAGTGGSFLHGFWYASVTRTKLVVGTTYIVAGVRGGADPTRNVTPGVSMNENGLVNTTAWVAGSGSGLVFPGTLVTTVTRAMGPNFVFVPAPSAAIVMVMAALVGHRGRRRDMLQ